MLIITAKRVASVIEYSYERRQISLQSPKVRGCHYEPYCPVVWLMPSNDTPLVVKSGAKPPASCHELVQRLLVQPVAAPLHTGTLVSMIVDMSWPHEMTVRCRQRWVVHAVTRSNEAQHEAYQKCFLEYYYCATVRGELSDIPARSAGPYIHVGQV
jgi:hypothetical protein